MEAFGTDDYKPPTRAELDSIGRGSMIQVIDPEQGLWYWVVVERQLEDRWFWGRIDAHCIIAGPTLRHGGHVGFHEDNILHVWPRKVDPIYDRRWFRIASHILSFGSGAKALKRHDKRI